jgi:hypothetical protein
MAETFFPPSSIPVNPAPQGKGGPIYTTGVKSPQVVCRLELHEFLEDKDLKNLYLLAMRNMMDREQDELDSWFQIAAIHGR